MGLIDFLGGKRCKQFDESTWGPWKYIPQWIPMLCRETIPHIEGAQVLANQDQFLRLIFVWENRHTSFVYSKEMIGKIGTGVRQRTGLRYIATG